MLLNNFISIIQEIGIVAILWIGRKFALEFLWGNNMKKFKWFFGLCVVVSLFAGCYTNDLDEPDVTPRSMGEIDKSLYAAKTLLDGLDSDGSKVLVAFYVPEKDDYTDRTAYIWLDEGADNKHDKAMTNGEKDGYKFGYLDLSTMSGSIPSDAEDAIKAKNDVKIIIKNKGTAWDWQTPDLVLPLSGGGKHFLITSGADKQSSCLVSVIPIGKEELAPAIMSANTKDGKTIEATLSVTLALETKEDSNGFYIQDAAKTTKVYASDVLNLDSLDDRYRNETRNVRILFNKPIDATKIWRLYNDNFGTNNALVSMQVASKDIASSTADAASKANDLGLTLNGTKATFKIWAPVASKVTLLLYTDASKVGNFNKDAVDKKTVGSTTDKELEGSPTSTSEMIQDKTTGIWSVSNVDVSAAKYYKYKIVNGGETYYVADINAKAASPDAIASQIVNINDGKPYGTKETYKNPFGKNGTETKNYTDAVIYEMHVTDWSKAADPTSTNVGKYLTVANSEKVIRHVKDLGVTHVQILPIFEFAETVANEGYNWGYNPYHYNVPESRYVTDMKDGMDAVDQLRTMINAFHDAGIAVIMDVVYNHTSGTQGGSLYDSTVPSYYYRFDGSGSYSNGSGCGNEVDTEAVMIKKYIIDSLKHWMLDYHINGFRFDLMGCMSKSTMKDIYKELSDIDKNVMVYGEPWTGGTAAVSDGAVQAVESESFGVGAFDDDFRDAIKGAEFGGFKKGQVQGIFNDDGILNGLCGKPGNNNRNETDKLGLALHYVECHDNYTLFDKLAMSYLNKTSFKGDLFARLENQSNTALNDVKAQDKLAAAYVFLSQGTPFINGGQEFLRTKRGNENSYNTNASDTNSIDLSFKTKYSDVYNTYKGLIALRKENPEAFGSNKDAKAETVKDADGKNINGVTKYTTGDFLVYFNATDKAVDITTTGYTKAVDVSSGTPKESATLPAKVDAKSFVILKK